MYIYMCIYVYIHTYVKWMSTGLIQSCHKNECSPVSYNLVIKMNAVLSHTILSKKLDAVLSHTILSKKLDAVLSHTTLS